MSEIEDDLYNMLKHFTAGKGGSDMLKKLAATTQINVLKDMQKELAKVQEKIGRHIQRLSKAADSASFPDTGNLNPYTILGVSPDADEAEVRKAYREKAAEAHPDKGGTNEKMILVNAALEAIRRFRGWK